MKIDFKELMLGFDYLNSAEPFEHEAVVDRTTGEVFCFSDFGDEEKPEDIEDEKYLSLPHKKDLGLGRELVFDFVIKNIPGEIETVESIFSKRGAYSRYKDFLANKELLDAWYQYEEQRQEAALREWCADHKIDLK